MINELRERLSSHTDRLGFNPLDVEQGAFDWFKMRLGVISASNCSKIFKPTRGAGLTRVAYMNELIGEICTGIPQDEISAKAMEWGKDNEPKARELYSLLGFGGVAQEIPFIYKDGDMRLGCSPDGIDGDCGIEIKCPFTTKVHIDFLLNGTIKKEYHDQMQFSMFVSGMNAWKFLSFDPRMTRKNIEVVTVERNEKRIGEIAQASADFIGEMDRALAQVGFSFGDQWQAISSSNIQQEQQHSVSQF